MAIPKAVQAQYDNALEMEKQSTLEEPEATQEEESVEEAPEAELAVEEEDVSGGLQRDDSYKQRYLVLKGKYDSEVPRLSSDLRSVQEELDRLSHEAEEKAKLLQELQQRQAADQTDVTLRRLEEEGEYPEEFVSILRSQDLQVRDLKDELASVKDTVSKLTKNTQQSKEQLQDLLVKRVRKSIKNMDKLNADPEFVAWSMRQNDDLYEHWGIQKTPDAVFRELMDEITMGNMDESVQRGVALYKRFMSSKGAASRELERQTSPSGNGEDNVTRTDAAGSKFIWGPALSQRFYDDARRGRYTQEEFARLEADLHRAHAEGRFDNSK